MSLTIGEYPINVTCLRDLHFHARVPAARSPEVRVIITRCHSNRISSFYSYAYIVCSPLDSDFSGRDISPKLLLLQGEGGRQFLQVFYIDDNISPIGKIKTLVPEYPDGAYNLLDACITFFPDWFGKFKTLQAMKEELSQKEFLDLNLEKPSDWDTLRDEALSRFKELRINTASFEQNWRAVDV